jgi:hypothetical protein
MIPTAGLLLAAVVMFSVIMLTFVSIVFTRDHKKKRMTYISNTLCCE